MEEVFDVVDGSDNVIYQASRSDVHRLRLMHRSVHVLLFNSQGDIFLQKRATHKKCNPGMWDTSAAGHVIAGERYDDAAARELNEELAVPLNNPLQRLFKLPAIADTGMEFTWVYQSIYDGEISLQRSEIDDGRWCRYLDMSCCINSPSAEITDSFKLIWSRYLMLQIQEMSY